MTAIRTFVASVTTPFTAATAAEAGHTGNPEPIPVRSVAPSRYDR